ncbi:arylphorin subunit alpha-like [Nasonia vitripennis]|uniref:Uncharacterized protein n=1 Tax=Nasonia vitripennis TaxID=7425 RepID=A0A7M7TCF4_NASVI|nr:arylphorin subunit alpha-like [Nasonia vitripennis]XP_032453317.1 arylphorin subunit alpha-like [Nasonia vitripennis]
MLRKLLVFALVAVSLAAASFEHAKYDMEHTKYDMKMTDKNMLMKQKKIFDLLMYINNQVLTDAEWFEMGRNYDIMSNIDYYTKKEVVMDFMAHYKFGMLRKDSIFTYYNQEHREEMMTLYKLFYFAKDFNTFYKTACWARIHMNTGLFTTAFTTAVLYRDDTKFIRLPAIYEMYPNMFFDSKVVRDAQRIMMTHGKTHLGHEMMGMKKTDDMNHVETFYLYSNFTEVCLNPMHNYENKMMYFMEDIGLNAFYYYYRMMFPFWMSTKEYSVPQNIRGELYYYFHQQLMARYYLERFSNGLGEIEDFSWDSMRLPGFYSDYMFNNGVSMPRRDWWNVVPFYKYRYLEYLKMLETRIMEAIDSGFIIDEMGKQVNIMCPEGLNILANIIEGNYDSMNMKYYGSYDVLSRRVLGMNYDAKNKDMYIPSSLENFSTSMKDPAFYRIYNKIVGFFMKYKSHLNRYTKNELEFSGVKIENVEIDKLYTYFDTREYMVNNLIDVASMKDGFSFNMKAWQYHLNYKPFTYKFAVNSDKSTKAIMRIFLGPAMEGYDDYSFLLHYYQYFFMLDEFEFNLHEGMNNFERKSHDVDGPQHEYMTGDRFYKKMMDAMHSKEGMHFNKQMWSFPKYMTLPKGSVDGMRFKLFFYISSFEEGKAMELPIFGQRMYYGKPFNFPIDRPMYPWFFSLGNVFFKDVFIYHQPEQEMIGYHNMNTMMHNSMQDSMYTSKPNMMHDSMQDYGKVMRMNRDRYMKMMQDIKKPSMMDMPEHSSMTMKTDYTMERMRDHNMMHV